jgi:ribosomal protein S18 acetylase RimI-like enzyme
VTQFRPFRNFDPPALARLWNLAIPKTGTVRPVRVHELDTHALGTVIFESAGLIVAESDKRIVGFVHAGFGPELPVDATAPFRLGHKLGTIAMLVVEPGFDDPGLVRGLLDVAEGYLRARGAKVVYAGGLFPLNPFYWGLYGGSEGSGVLSGHDVFHRGLRERGYEPVGATVLLQADLDTPEPRDPRATLVRRHAQAEFVEDALPSNWWEGMALAEFDVTDARLLTKSDGTELARAATWEMRGFGREDGRSRLGLIRVEVPPEHRRKGYARFLLSEIFRRARAGSIGFVDVQAAATNEPALALYASLGFTPIDQCTLYRLSAEGARGP